MKPRINYRWYLWQHTWLQFETTLSYLHQRYALEGLVEWARRKRLGVLDFYQRRLTEVEEAISTKRIRYPQIAKWAWFAFQINRLISPTPKYYPKGYATRYSLKT